FFLLLALMLAANRQVLALKVDFAFTWIYRQQGYAQVIWVVFGIAPGVDRRNRGKKRCRILCPLRRVSQQTVEQSIEVTPEIEQPIENVFPSSYICHCHSP